MSKETKETIKSGPKRQRPSRRKKKTKAPAVAESTAPPPDQNNVAVPEAKQVDVASLKESSDAQGATDQQAGAKKTRSRGRGRRKKTIRPAAEASATDATTEDGESPRTGGDEADRTSDVKIAEAPTTAEEPASPPRRPGQSRRRRGSRKKTTDRSTTDDPPATAEVQEADRSARERTESSVSDEGDRRPGDKKEAIAVPERREQDRTGKQAPESRKGKGRPRRAVRGRTAGSGAESAAPAAADEDLSAESTANERGTREMLINVSAGDECRIAVLHEGLLEELFIERDSTLSRVGNIYKGRITNVEASIQAVFVDFGLPQNGFLHISDVQPQYFPDHKGEPEDVGRKIPRHNRPPIQKCFRRGQEVIVQVTKDGVGTKGPTLTTYLSLPGRFLVMMPGMSRQGVSRKIEDEVERRNMRDLLSQLELPAGMGFILRTAGSGRSKRELQRDLQYLMRLWRIIADRIKKQPAPAELYEESDLVTRTIRDVFTVDFHRLTVDDAETAKRASEFLRIAMPRGKTTVELYSKREPLFHRYGIESEIEKINMRKVPLRSGGSIVIDSTEALVAIDVNSGRFRTSADAEETAFKINMEAAEEIARQLRLRDLGGLIVCDFIDMRLDRHKREVERAVRDAVKKHKERARALKMNAFGLIVMTRQRQGPSLKRNIYYDCTHCKGTGLVKMPDSVILDVMRVIQLAAHHDSVHKVTVSVAADLAYDLLNAKRSAIGQIELETGKTIIIRGNAGFTSDQVVYACEDIRGGVVNVLPSPVNQR